MVLRRHACRWVQLVAWGGVFCMQITGVADVSGSSRAHSARPSNRLEQGFTRVAEGPMVTDGRRSWGAAWIDVDGDGWLDLFVANLDGNRLYLNSAGSGFVEVSGDILVTDPLGWGGGCTWADSDNDGDADVFVANWEEEHNLLYINRGDGSFAKVESVAPVERAGWSISPSWIDYDNDGRLDLYVANHDSEQASGEGQNSLYHNDGDGFSVVTDSPVVAFSSHSNHASWADYDNDGDLDVLVLNAWSDDRSNRLFRNDGGGTFTAVSAGDVTDDDGDAWGASWGDIDNDGDLDLVVTSQPENLLYENDGRGRLTRVSVPELTPTEGVSFGSGWADADNDGDLDLLIAVDSFGGPVANLFFSNDGHGGLSRVSSGEVVTDLDSSSGVAWGDSDHDGDLDLYVTNDVGSGGDNALYRNTRDGGSWINLRLVGVESNRSAIGARVEAIAIVDGRNVRQTREISSQTGKNGQSSLRVHFGFADANRIERLTLKWPSGLVEVHRRVAVNQFMTLREGDGEAGEARPRRPRGRRLLNAPQRAGTSAMQ